MAFAIHSVTTGNTIGNDILVFYLAARSSLISGQGPYLSENAMLSQMLTYGKLAQAGEDYLTFSYPPFALFPIFPLVLLPFEWAQALWQALLLLSLILAVLLFYPKAPRWATLSVFLVYPLAFGLLMGNFVVAIFAILLANFAWLFFYPHENKTIEVLLSIALAWTLAKPQFSWIYVVFILIAVIRQRRKTYLLSFIIAGVSFLALSFLIYPNWIPIWLQQISFYAQTNPSQIHLTSLLSLLLPSTLVVYLQIPILIGLLIWAGWEMFQYWKRKAKPFKVLLLVGLCSHLLYPGGVAYQQLVFFLPFFVWIALPNDEIPPVIKPILWITAILISWLELILPRFYQIKLPFSEWFFITYLLWFLFIIFFNKKWSLIGISTG